MGYVHDNLKAMKLDWEQLPPPFLDNFLKQLGIQNEPQKNKAFERLKHKEHQKTTCEDMKGWKNPYGYTCGTYKKNTWCVNGHVGRNKFGATYHWTLGPHLGFPERACCVCGGGNATAPPAPKPCAPLPFRDPVIQRAMKRTYVALIANHRNRPEHNGVLETVCMGLHENGKMMRTPINWFPHPAVGSAPHLDTPLKELKNRLPRQVRALFSRRLRMTRKRKLRIPHATADRNNYRLALMCDSLMQVVAALDVYCELISLQDPETKPKAEDAFSKKDQNAPPDAKPPKEQAPVSPTPMICRWVGEQRKPGKPAGGLMFPLRFRGRRQQTPADAATANKKGNLRAKEVPVPRFRSRLGAGVGNETADPNADKKFAAEALKAAQAAKLGVGAENFAQWYVRQQMGRLHRLLTKPMKGDNATKPRKLFMRLFVKVPVDEEEESGAGGTTGPGKGRSPSKTAAEIEEENLQTSGVPKPFTKALAKQNEKLEKNIRLKQSKPEDIKVPLKAFLQILTSSYHPWLDPDQDKAITLDEASRLFDEFDKGEPDGKVTFTEWTSTYPKLEKDEPGELRRKIHDELNSKYSPLSFSSRRKVTELAVEANMANGIGYDRSWLQDPATTLTMVSRVISEPVLDFNRDGLVSNGERLVYFQAAMDLNLKRLNTELESAGEGAPAPSHTWAKSGRDFRTIRLPVEDVTKAYDGLRAEFTPFSHRRLEDSEYLDRQLKGAPPDKWMSSAFINSHVAAPDSPSRLGLIHGRGRGRRAAGNAAGNATNATDTRTETDVQKEGDWAGWNEIPLSELMGGDWAVDNVDLPSGEEYDDVETPVDQSYRSLTGKELCRFVLMQAQSHEKPTTTKKALPKKGSPKNNTQEEKPPLYALPVSQWRPGVKKAKAYCSNVICYSAVQRCLNFLDGYEDNGSSSTTEIVENDQITG